MKIIKKYICILAVFLTVLPLCACEKKDASIELWLVTEESQGAGMNQQAELMIEWFRELYPDVTIRLDIMPRSQESRSAYLKKIRAEIMSGDGPDLYLLPTAPQLYPEDEVASTPYMEPLFSSASQMMYNGIFTDISEFYDRDATLGKEGLVEGVMNAGVMDGGRYVLPLRYDYEVLLVDRNAVEDLGIDPAIFEGSVLDLYALAETLGEENAAHALNVWPDYTTTSDYIDFETGKIFIDTREIVDLVNGYNRSYELSNPNAHQEVGQYFYGTWKVLRPAYEGYQCSIDSYIYTISVARRIFNTCGYPFLRMSLENVVDASAAIKVQEQDIAMYPVRSADGSVVAEITYYAAVGSGCKYPEIAYEFLRLFFSEEMQWEQYWPRNAGLGLEGMVEAGFPVRSKGYANCFWQNKLVDLEADQKADIKAKNFKYTVRREYLLAETFTITDEDVPILSTHVDEARFPVISTEGELFSIYLPTVKDAADAQKIINDLEWSLAEG